VWIHFVFYLPLLAQRGLTKEKWLSRICDLVKFYEGGLTFQYAFSLSAYSLNKLGIEAAKISSEMKQKSKG
jgi:hypothetical protein